MGWFFRGMVWLWSVGVDRKTIERAVTSRVSGDCGRARAGISERADIPLIAKKKLMASARTEGVDGGRMTSVLGNRGDCFDHDSGYRLNKNLWIKLP